MDTIRDGPSHPLCLAAVAVLVVNDHVLKAAFPGVVTGKLSDVAWLVVAPVVVAAVLARLRVPDRPARAAAVGLVAAAFVTLQLWPPLGEAWVAWTGGRHVADAEDLLALPALLLVPLCWRRQVRPLRLALPIAALACIATSYDINCDDTRLPADGAADVDPNAPLRLGFMEWQAPVADAPGLLSAITLAPTGGEPVELVAVSWSNQVVLCPVGGLAPDTDYEWTLRPFESTSPNHLHPPSFRYPGTTSFRTAAAGLGEPAWNERDCLERAPEVEVCGRRRFDTGDTAAEDTDDTDPIEDTDAEDTDDTDPIEDTDAEDTDDTDPAGP